MSATTGIVQGDVLHSNDSKSLWNYTLSPGWTEKEVEVFRIALMKFGIGRWTAIVESRCLPGKTVAQLNNQAQRMIGQQSTSAFTGLHIDPSNVFANNALKTGHRKNGTLINMDNNPTREDIERKKKENKEKWGLSKEEIEALVIPVLAQEDTSAVVVKSTMHNLKDTSNRRQEKYNRVRELQSIIAKIAKQIDHVKENGVDAMDVDQENSPDKKNKKGGKAVNKNKTPEVKSKAASKVFGKKGTQLAAAKAAKQPAKRKSSAKKTNTKTTEETDLEMAMRLQREEEGDDAMEDSDSDFEKPKKKRRSASSRRRR